MECVVYRQLIYAHSVLPTLLSTLLIMVVQRLLAWPKQASSEARNIVLGVISSHKEPISTRDLFRLAIKAPAPPRANEEPLTPWAKYLKNSKPAPPYPNHPVRSLRCAFHATLTAIDVHTSPAAT